MTSAKNIAEAMLKDEGVIVQQEPDWVPFPVEVLPEPLSQFVQETAAAIGCDPAMVALPVLGVVGSAIGTTRCIELKRGSWKEYPIVWAVVIASSGEKKSPAMEAAVAPLHQFQAKQFKEYEAKLVEYEAAALKYDAELKEWRQIKKKENRGDPPMKPEPPLLRRYVLSETTVEAVAPIHEENPRGLLVARDELSGWFLSFNQYKAKGGGDLANWLEMFRGGIVIIDRKTGRLVIRIPRAGVSVVGTIQPGVLASILTPQFFAAGLPARILAAAPPRKRKLWSDADVPERTARDYARVIERLLELEFDLPESGELTPVRVPMTPGARRLYIDFYNEFAGEQEREGDEDVIAAYSKIEAYAVRFALIFQLVGWANECCSSNEVDEDSMRRGIAIARWFAQETRRVYGLLKESDQDREVRAVVELMQRRGGSITARQLMQSARRYRSDVAIAERALQRLVTVGRAERIEVNHGGGAGRPTTLFRLKPSANGNKTAEPS